MPTLQIHSSLNQSALADQAAHLILARTLDREADALLHLGRHRLAEHLAERAAELRAEATR